MPWTWQGLGNSFLDATIPPEVSLVDEAKLESLAPTEAELAVLGEWLHYQRDLAPYARAKSWGTVAALYFTGYFFSHRRPEDFAHAEEVERLITWQVRKHNAQRTVTA